VVAQDQLVHVVDDDDAVRRSLDFMLRSAGYKVERWEDGVAFLKGVDPTQPACVLLDVRMPVMDGLEVQERLLEAIAAALGQLSDKAAQRQREQWAKTQVGALTDREREVLEGLACGYPNKTIAYDLGISSRTVEVYRANVMTKLEVGNFADALRVAFAAGMGSEEAWKTRYSVGQPRRET
jgi:two-component system response regulator FixJ